MAKNILTKGEIITGILDCDDIIALREVNQVLRNRIERLSTSLFDTKIAPLVGRGNTVRVAMRWSHGEIRWGTIVKVNRKKVLCNVEGMPPGRSQWNIPKYMIIGIEE